ncbi:unnamed protein product [Allacma fusca]|uniref:Uncharacterized protein n=1 Tax=Allacma fusca TaxID=39272 RepID=A0A8J2NWI9_9HEXA|nr:unnamed protein product [Allacma fusca]
MDGPYKNQLTKYLDSPELAFTFLARYDHSTNAILKDLTKCTWKAERVYDDEMEGFEPSQKSENEIKERHNLAREKAMAKFQDLLKTLNVDAGVCSKEIEWKLQENLQDLSEEWVVVETKAEQTNVGHELHPGQNNTPYLSGGKPRAPGDLPIGTSSTSNDDVEHGITADMPNPSRGNSVVQNSIHDRRDSLIGWLKFIWAKLFGRNC